LKPGDMELLAARPLPLVGLAGELDALLCSEMRLLQPAGCCRMGDPNARALGATGGPSVDAEPGDAIAGLGMRDADSGLPDGEAADGVRESVRLAAGWLAAAGDTALQDGLDAAALAAGELAGRCCVKAGALERALADTERTNPCCSPTGPLLTTLPCSWRGCLRMRLHSWRLSATAFC
jgi:hypothetical protein